MTADNKNILLIEDDYIDIVNVQRVLKKINFDHLIRVAKNGLEALDLIQNSDGTVKYPLPNVILLDLNMPRMNGMEFLKVLRSNEELSGLNVFVMTTSSEEGDKIMAKNYGVSGYIVKPFTFDKFEDSETGLDSFGLLLDLLKM